MVQVICSVAIRVIQTMPEDFDKEQQKEKEIKSGKKKEKSPEVKEGEVTVLGMCMLCVASSCRALELFQFHWNISDSGS